MEFTQAELIEIRVALLQHIDALKTTVRIDPSAAVELATSQGALDRLNSLSLEAVK